jgi:hypothetical protein
MKLDSSFSLLAPDPLPPPARHAAAALARDWRAVLGAPLRRARKPARRQVRLAFADLGREEAFRVTVTREPAILVEGNDDLGLVFGIYHVCEQILGVEPFHFWTDLPPARRKAIAVREGARLGEEPAVRFRGWFVNGEDCLVGWHDEMRISLPTWRVLFETMLRAGFNMVIPGTGVSPTDPQVDLAAEMGLWVTQHHAEPLGARMFREAYPGVPARWPEEWPRFEALYREAIHAAKGRKTVWAVGFRGQGDQPFYRDDPRHETPDQRGAVIAEAIRRQQALVRELSKGPHHFAHNVYGESALLYREGHLPLPDDVVRVWGDNGFGAMCARRMSAHPGEARVPATPLPQDRERFHGVYYHVNFHDLQVSNQVAPLVAPGLIQDELGAMLRPAGFRYLTLNVGNVRPHAYAIGLVGRMVRHPLARLGSSTDWAVEHAREFCARHFPGFEKEAADIIRLYHEAPFAYGPLRDERVGDEGLHHPLRTGIACALSGENASTHVTFRFIADRPPDSEGCFRWMRDRAAPAIPKWEELDRRAAALVARAPKPVAARFRDSFGMFIGFHLHSTRGLVAGMDGLLAWLKEDWKPAFVRFAEALAHTEAALAEFHRVERGKWRRFYRGEWLTGTTKTVRALDVILGAARLRGDTGWPRSTWVLEALGAERHAIGLLGQSAVDDRRLATALARRREAPPGEDLSLLR